MVYYCRISDFDDEFFLKAVEYLPNSKKTSVLKTKNIKSKRETILAWLLLRFSLGSDAESLFKRVRFSSNGKPSFENEQLYFNLSHSKDLVCAAISLNGEIGVDIQAESNFKDNLISRVFSENEIEKSASASNKNTFFTRIWAIKESFLKQNGCGIAFDLKSLDFSESLCEETFKSEKLFFSVKKLEEYYFSVCASSDEPQSFEEISVSSLKNMIK